jgi:ankyrin repeat protein
MRAVAFGKGLAVKLLIENGANLNIANRGGQTVRSMVS